MEKKLLFFYWNYIFYRQDYMKQGVTYCNRNILHRINHCMKVNEIKLLIFIQYIFVNSYIDDSIRTTGIYVSIYN